MATFLNVDLDAFVSFQRMLGKTGAWHFLKKMTLYEADLKLSPSEAKILASYLEIYKMHSLSSALSLTHMLTH